MNLAMCLRHVIKRHDCMDWISPIGMVFIARNRQICGTRGENIATLAIWTLPIRAWLT